MDWSGILVLLFWPAWNHTTTSFWRLSYIERILLSPDAFSGLKILYTRLLIAFTSPLSGWGGLVGGVGWKGREREGEENRSIPVLLFSTLSPGWGYGLVVVVAGDMSEGGGLCWFTQAVKCCEQTPRWPTHFLVGSTRVTCFLIVVFECVVISYVVLDVVC